MKTVITKIGRVVFNRYFIIIVLVLLACVGALWWYTNYSLKKFEAAYTAYAALATAQQTAAFIPGTGDNQLRAQLNATLAQVLDASTKDKDRLTLAHQGLDLIEQSNAQIDAIGAVTQDVTDASDQLDTAANLPGNLLHKSAMEAIVAVAKQELYTIEDIKALSYRANFQTAEIFNRIITDNGALTADYTKELNSDLPDAEVSYNKRQDSYNDLQKQMSDIAQDYSQLAGS